MSYLSMIIALFKTWKNEATIPQGAWLDVYLDNLVVVEKFFLSLSWWIFGTVIILAIAIGIISAIRGSGGGFSAGLGLGCVAAFLLLLPLLEWVSMKLAIGMASAVGPEGIIDSGRFWINMIIFVLIGAG